MRANYGSIIKNLNTVTKWLERGLTKPGCWAYPDMLEVGCFNGPGGTSDSGLNMAETRTHFGAWAIVSSPLILSHDMLNDTVTDIIWPVIANTEAIAVNQAWHGSAGGIFKESEELVQLHYKNDTASFYFSAPAYRYYYKPISDSEVAVLMLNMKSNAPLLLSVDDIPGWPTDSTADIRDIWKHQNVGKNSNVFTCTAGMHDCCFLVVTKSQKTLEKQKNAA